MASDPWNNANRRWDGSGDRLWHVYRQNDPMRTQPIHYVRSVSAKSFDDAVQHFCEHHMREQGKECLWFIEDTQLTMMPIARRMDEKAADHFVPPVLHKARVDLLRAGEEPLFG